MATTGEWINGKTLSVDFCYYTQTWILERHELFRFTMFILLIRMTHLNISVCKLTLTLSAHGAATHDGKSVFQTTA